MSDTENAAEQAGRDLEVALADIKTAADIFNTHILETLGNADGTEETAYLISRIEEHVFKAESAYAILWHAKPKVEP